MTHPFITPFTLLPWWQTLANQHWAATGNYILFSWEIFFFFYLILLLYLCAHHVIIIRFTRLPHYFWWLRDSETSVLSLLDDWYRRIFSSLVRKCVATYVKHLFYLLSQNCFIALYLTYYRFVDESAYNVYADICYLTCHCEISAVGASCSIAHFIFNVSEAVADVATEEH